MLKVQDLHVYYGGIHAVKGVSLSVDAGEIVTLVGANGAGKSTTLRTISGLLRARSGQVFFEGADISQVAANAIVKKGLCHVPEGRRVFSDMSVMENLELGAYLRRDGGKIKQDMDWVFELFPRLKERKAQAAGTLSGGEQQMLAIGRGLMASPRLLLLDEPSMGLAPLLVREIFDIVKQINSTGVTVLLIEQNAHMALSIAHKAYVIENGSIVLSGKASEVAADDQVRKAYLGG